MAKKVFYITEACGGDGIAWPTTNFTEDELAVIDRFLTEVDTKARGIIIEDIIIMEDTNF